uniref:Potassium channel tetramerization domain containing 14 n=1 Tax=Callorhinchus milii TaxID=7868 RepID=A0A4W3GXL7_CALMI
ALTPDCSVSQVVSLNVGGHIYTSTLATLRKFPRSRLSELVGSPTRHGSDSEGRLFIDRDGTHFRHVLDYLRGLDPPAHLASEIYQEAVFYRLEPLVKLLEESPRVFGEMVGRQQFLSRVPGYRENIEVMIRVARAEAVASRRSLVTVCVVRGEDDLTRCQEEVGGLGTGRGSVVTFGPWQAPPTAADLLHSIQSDIEKRGYTVTWKPLETGKGFLSRTNFSKKILFGDTGRDM